MKATFIDKMSCDRHEDKTPSVAIYSDGSRYCFSCNTYSKGDGEVVITPKTPPEDIKESIKRILTLPVMGIRGLILPYDTQGYYLVWLDKSYYKCRRWLPNDKVPKYGNPIGISQPWLNLTNNKAKSAIIIEGEINALSAKEVYPEVSVYCPGSAGQFKLNKCGLPLTHFSRYEKIVLIADKDNAGVAALIKLKLELNAYNSDVSIQAITTDFNEVLVTHGKEALRQIIKEMGV